VSLVQMPHPILPRQGIGSSLHKRSGLIVVAVQGVSPLSRSFATLTPSRLLRVGHKLGTQDAHFERECGFRHN
jgi:hypothetical protein